MINPIEAVIQEAVIGRIENPKPLKPTDKLLRKLDKLDKTLRTSIRDWILSSKPSKIKHESLNFMELKEAFETFSMEQALEIFIDWEEQANIATALMDSVSAINELRPVNASTTLFGTDDLPPSNFEQDKWLRTIQVFNNPQHVVDLMYAGTLSGHEVEALELLYPSTLATIQEAAVEAVAELRGKDIKNIGMQKMAILATLMQVPRLSPERLIGFQESFQEEDEEMQVNQKPIRAADRAQTSLSKVENR